MENLVHNENVTLEGHNLPLVSQITDFFVPEADKSKRILSKTKIEEIDYSKPPPEFKVVLYGSTAKGHSVCAEVTGYQPYFYLSVDDDYS